MSRTFAHTLPLSHAGREGAFAPEAVQRAMLEALKSPASYLDGLTGSEILEETDRGFTRRLSFGELCIEDSILRLEDGAVRQAVAAGVSWSASVLVMHPVSASTGSSYVRFEYESEEPQGEEDPFRRIVFEAWRRKDADFLRHVRAILLRRN